MEKWNHGLRGAGIPTPSPAGDETERMLTAARLAGLAALLWITAHQPPSKGVAANHPVKWLLMAVAGFAWIGWMASRRLRAPGRTTWCFLALLAGSGGALAAFAPNAITFMAVAGLGAGIAFEGLPAFAVGAIGVARWRWLPQRCLLRLLIAKEQSPWSSD